MIYKHAAQIYLEEIRDKGLFVPRLSYLDEVNFNLLNEEINRIADILNVYPSWRQFWMWNLRREYNSLVRELMEFYSFWGFSKHKDIRIDKLTTKEWQ